MTIMASTCKVTITEDDEDDLKNEDDVTDGDVADVSSADEEVQEDEGNNAVINEGWADSIAKILKTNKPKGKKTLVLAKAKKLSDLRKTRTKDAGFEVEGENGKIKQEQILTDIEKDSDVLQPLRKKRKELLSVRVKPNILQKDKERTLSKIATRGVVQLFNAVKKQQKDIDNKLKDAGPLEVKRDRVMKNIDKREFLNVLMGDKSKHIEKTIQAKKDNQIKSKTEEPTWSVLRNDFMMGANMKDWDKEEESEKEMEQEAEFE